MPPIVVMDVTERIGRLPGASRLGFVTDRSGPKRILVAVVVMFGVFMICTEFGTSLNHFCLFRGLGLGGAMPSPISGLLEMAGTRLYPAWVSLTSSLRTGKPDAATVQSGNTFGSATPAPNRLRSHA
jgi:MFS family permease